MPPTGRARVFGQPLALALLTLALFQIVWPPSRTRAQTPPVQPPSAAASADSPPTPLVEAFRLHSPVRLDGVLDEPVWQGPSAAPLIQNDPVNGAKPRLRTDWWVAYDDEALYVAARLFDPAPDSIGAKLGRRDNRPDSDFVTLMLDTFDDNRNCYLLSVNAGGSIKDSIVYNDGGGEDLSWDGVWDCATRVDAQGWTVEMRVPFSQLGFPERTEQVWGIDFVRKVLRNQERDDIFFWPRGSSGIVSQFPRLTGLRDVRAGRHLEALAYGAGRAERTHVAPGDPFHDGSAYKGNAGLDLSWGLSNSLSLSATVNPDFGQVEIDPAVVNLQDFETLFEEKRPFFVRDANAFRFGREGTASEWNFQYAHPTLFYSRRVGRAPQLPPPPSEFVDQPGETTILGAAKLSGKLMGATLGALAAVTGHERADLFDAGRTRSQTVEPLTGYGVLRLQQTGADGRRGLGVMTTHVSRSLDERSRQFLPGSAHVAGLDGWTSLDRQGTWAMKGYLSASRVAGDAATIDLLQRSQVRYLQRPGRTGLAYDPRRTSLSGWAGRTVLNKQSGSFTLNTAFGAISPGFEANDVGYQRRADAMNWHLVTGYYWLEPNRTFRSRGFDTGAWRTWDFGGHPSEYGYFLFPRVTFANYWYVGGEYYYSPDRWSLSLTRGGPVMRVPAYQEATLSFASDTRRNLIAEGRATLNRAEDGTRGASGSLTLTIRPSAALRITAGPSLQWLQDHAMWVANVEDPAMTVPGGVRYLLGDMEYREFSMATRVDWTFTPRLTLQSYLQPLIASAHYTGLRQLARPGSFEFDRFGENGSTIERLAAERQYRIDPDGAGPTPAFTIADPDFNYKSLKVNLILRWEYRPGSTAYFVWTQNRLNLDDPGDFRLGRDTRSLLNAPGDDIFMLKVTTWLSL